MGIERRGFFKNNFVVVGSVMVALVTILTAISKVSEGLDLLISRSGPILEIRQTAARQAQINEDVKDSMNRLEIKSDVILREVRKLGR